VVAAVHVHGPSYRFPPPGAEDKVAGVVAGAAERISTRLSSGAADDPA
jgi:DNA-binding IclR family transcriptional regulator